MPDKRIDPDSACGLTLPGERIDDLGRRGYRIIQKNRFQPIMDRVPAKIKPGEWQSIVNDEAALCAPKTLKNAWGFLRTIIHEVTGEYPPDVKLPAQVQNDHGFLTPDQIRTFVRAVAPTQYAIPALLALSSLRISEIEALHWEDIPKDLKLIRVAGAVVLDEKNNRVKRQPIRLPLPPGRFQS